MPVMRARFTGHGVAGSIRYPRGAGSRLLEARRLQAGRTGQTACIVSVHRRIREERGDPRTAYCTLRGSPPASDGVRTSRGQGRRSGHGRQRGLGRSAEGDAGGRAGTRPSRTSSAAKRRNWARRPTRRRRAEQRARLAQRDLRVGHMLERVVEGDRVERLRRPRARHQACPGGSRCHAPPPEAAAFAEGSTPATSIRAARTTRQVAASATHIEQPSRR